MLVPYARLCSRACTTQFNWSLTRCHCAPSDLATFPDTLILTVQFRLTQVMYSTTPLRSLLLAIIITVTMSPHRMHRWLGFELCTCFHRRCLKTRCALARVSDGFFKEVESECTLKDWAAAAASASGSTARECWDDSQCAPGASGSRICFLCPLYRIHAFLDDAVTWCTVLRASTRQVAYSPPNPLRQLL